MPIGVLIGLSVVLIGLCVVLIDLSVVLIGLSQFVVLFWTVCCVDCTVPIGVFVVLI